MGIFNKLKKGLTTGIGGDITKGLLTGGMYNTWKATGMGKDKADPPSNLGGLGSTIIPPPRGIRDFNDPVSPAGDTIQNTDGTVGSSLPPANNIGMVVDATSPNYAPPKVLPPTKVELTPEQIAARNQQASTVSNNASAADKALADKVNKIPPVPVEDTGYQGDPMENKLYDEIMADAQGESAEVIAARDRLDREKVLRLNEANRMAHERAIGMGYRPGTAQYDQIMRQAQNDATRQNIEAENELNAFARETRLGTRDQMAAMGEMKYGRFQDELKNSNDKFATFIKFIPSLKGQSMAALNEATGGDFATFFKGMWDSNGELKAEYQDPNKPDVALDNLGKAFANVTVHPTTKQPWTPAEKDKYVEELWAGIIGTQYNPVSGEGERLEELKITENRIENALSSKNYESLTKEDWKAIKPNDRATLFSQSISFDNMGNGNDDWNKMDNIKVADAKRIWLRDNPISQPDMKGKLVTKDGIVYKITVPMEVHEYPGGNNKKIYVKAINTETGEEKVIYKSDIFESKADWNPLD